jgi:chromosome partitioning protein
MHSILVLNPKGGSGKTTVATNLAGYFASNGAKVALADFDRQRSSLDWLSKRPIGARKIDAVDAVGSTFRVAKNTEIVILDAPSGTVGTELTHLLRKSQVVIIPVVPSPVDIRAAERFFEELQKTRPLVRNDVRIASIACRFRTGGKNEEALEDFLYDLKLPSGRRLPFLTMIRQSVNYLRSAERGLSIFEFAPLTTSTDREYWRPLLRWLKKNT